MESMYKIKNPMLLKADPLYSRYGHIGIYRLLQDEYSKLFAEHEWPALAPLIPSNSEANAGKAIKVSGKKGACFECGSTDHYRDTCPKLNRQKGGNNNNNSNNNNNNATNKEWKYIAPLDETTTLKGIIRSGNIVVTANVDTLARLGYIICLTHLVSTDLNKLQVTRLLFWKHQPEIMLRLAWRRMKVTEIQQTEQNKKQQQRRR